jgi:hypothetical protein
MLKPVRIFAVLASLSLGVAGLGACGGSGGGGPGDVVAQVGTTAITKATLDHWVATFIRGDYYSAIGRKAPAGLGSDPPNYAACASAAKAAAQQASSGTPQLGKAQLERKCHELYDAVRPEALSYLISVLWSIGEGKERGQEVTDAEVSRKLAKVVSEQYPKQGQLETFLTDKGWTLADMRYILKRNILAATFLASVEKEANNQGSGQRTLVKLVNGITARWAVKTSCHAGYVVWQCKQYRAAAATASATPAPAAVLEEMAKGL